jgi:hypothetical protein
MRRPLTWNLASMLSEVSISAADGSSETSAFSRLGSADDDRLNRPPNRWSGNEPPLEEVLRGSVPKAVMRADGTSAKEVKALLKRVKT